MPGGFFDMPIARYIKLNCIFNKKTDNSICKFLIPNLELNFEKLSEYHCVDFIFFREVYYEKEDDTGLVPFNFFIDSFFMRNRGQQQRKRVVQAGHGEDCAEEHSICEFLGGFR
jgi:hypothetical protein